LAKSIKLSRKVWTLGARIGDRSGFGKVYEATADDGETAVAKLVPKEPGAERELLFEELSGVPNIVPIIDTGETKNELVLVMPRAERSLRREIDARSRKLTLDEALPILIDIATALAAIDGRVVHRDLKPENVLFLDGHWCLADFGIARYAEASTAPDTKKWAKSPQYAAPERWREERATSASDVYSLGIMAWEMLMGDLPFSGPDWPEFREQHLHGKPPEVTGVPAAVASLVDECLFKPPGARPTPKNFLARLERANTPSSPAVARLQEVGQKIVVEQSKELASASAATTEKQRRAELFTAAEESLKTISDQLRQAILDAVSATPDPRSTHTGWALRLGDATIGMDQVNRVSMGNFGLWQPAFDLIADTGIAVNIPPGLDQFHGRAHSLWYGDIQEKGVYRWFETAFMVSPLLPRRATHVPAGMDPGEESGAAIRPGMNSWQLARPFVPIDQGETTAFIERWLDWLAQGAAGTLRMPSSMPEMPAEGTWRRS
jgi:serine/threonine protein kinase